MKPKIHEHKSSFKNFASKIVLLAAAFFVSASAFAQHDHSGHQSQTSKTNTVQQPAAPEASQQPAAQLLTHYYNIKNALVAGDAASAATNAQLYVQELNQISHQLISETNAHILLADAGKIADAKDINRQRTLFANFSANMAEVIKAVKPGSTVYIQYCPMKKASWLSSEKAIKNPYYGSSMLTCGKVTNTIQ